LLSLLSRLLRSFFPVFGTPGLSSFAAASCPTTSGLASVGQSTGNNGRLTRRMIGYNPFIWFVFMPYLRPFNGDESNPEDSESVRANRDLPPIRAIADRQTRHSASPANAQMNHTPWKLRRRHACSRGRGHIGKRRNLNLFTAPNPLETARNLFTHIFLFQLMLDGVRAKPDAMFNFEKLDTWQRAIDFADLVYTLTMTFPSDERFGLTNQMRRAAVSISSNLAEGSTRNSRQDFARFVEIATGSLFEVVSQATIAMHQGFMSTDQHRQLYSAAEEQGKMLSGLRRSLMESHSA
jgi:four helix bundle protein